MTASRQKSSGKQFDLLNAESKSYLYFYSYQIGSGFPITRDHPIATLPRLLKAVSGCALGAPTQFNAECFVRMELHLLLTGLGERSSRRRDSHACYHFCRWCPVWVGTRSSEGLSNAHGAPV
jgi:hypothetical protein